MAAVQNRITNILLVLVLLTLVSLIGMLATSVRGGPLDPSDPPSPTMKTLDEIGSWSSRLPANDGSIGPNPPTGCDSSRFECLEDFDNQLALDRETGLVWDRDADWLGAVDWYAAQEGCLTSVPVVGGGARRGGFRLPTYEELQSLVEMVSATAPWLPAGHPFAGVVTADHYWTATSNGGTTA
mgnify:CR=1 FL=1